MRWDLYFSLTKIAVEYFVICNPSIDVVSSWIHVKTYTGNTWKANHNDAEPIYFAHYGPETLHDILATQT